MRYSVLLATLLAVLTFSACDKKESGTTEGNTGSAGSSESATTPPGSSTQK